MTGERGARAFVVVGVAVLVLLVASALRAQRPLRRPAATAIVVASKPFGESFLLAEMFAQLLERSGRTVVRRPGLGTTDVAFQALRAGAVDVYPEYTGTGLVAILGDSLTDAMRADSRSAYAHVATATLQRFGVTWLPPLGFQNGYAIAVRRATLGAFIGAGGLGEPIVTGLGLADARLVLSGALPAALMAVGVDAALAVVSRRVAPAHLRRRAA